MRIKVTKDLCEIKENEIWNVGDYELLVINTYSSCPLSFVLTFSRSFWLRTFSWDLKRSFLIDGFLDLSSSFAENSLKAAVITSTSRALKKTRYRGGSADLSFFSAKSMLYFFATRSKDLIFWSVTSILVNPVFWRISWSIVCFPW